jgi:hypothetical protein
MLLWGSYRIPFGTTDYDELKSHYVAEGILSIVDKDLAMAQAMACRAITPNPFHMPGKIQISRMRLPSLGNGFVTSILRVEEGNPEE